MTSNDRSNPKKKTIFRLRGEIRKEKGSEDLRSMITGQGLIERERDHTGEAPGGEGGPRALGSEPQRLRDKRCDVPSTGSGEERIRGRLNAANGRERPRDSNGCPRRKRSERGHRRWNAKVAATATALGTNRDAN